MRVVRAFCRFIKDSKEQASATFWTEVTTRRLGCHINEETRVRSNDETTCSVDTEEVGLENNDSIGDWMTSVQEKKIARNNLGMTRDLRCNPVVLLGHVLFHLSS